MFNYNDKIGYNNLKIAPNIHLNYIWQNENECIIVYSDADESQIFYGNQLTVKILQEIKKNTQAGEIINRLNKYGNVEEIKKQLALLLQIKVVINANYQMSDGLASFWLSENILPIEAQRKLKQQSFCIINHSKQKDIAKIMQNKMRQIGLNIANKSENATIDLVIVDDYLQEELTAINNNYYQKKYPWIPILLTGRTPIIGPIFNDKQTDYCCQCLTKRIKENRQIRSTIARYLKDAELIMPSFIDEGAISSIAYQFALEIAKHIVIGNVLNNKLSSFNWSNRKVSYHSVNKIPQCAICGKPYKNNRKLAKFIFDDVKQTIKTSGGYKTTTPSKTVAKYKHLVSPISGVVSHLKFISDENDDHSYVYESGNNIALKSDNIHISLNSVRMKNAGKGTSKQQAKASALCESIERYCSSYQGDEIFVEKRFIDFKKGQALLPNTFMHYSENQFKQAKQINSNNIAFYYIPNKIALDKKYKWSPIWSIFEDKEVWVPTQLLYFGYPYNNKCIAAADTNGVAAGNTNTEAFVQAFLECIERDNIAIWWYNRLQYKEVDLKNFNDYSRKIFDIYLNKYQRNIYAIDISNDLNIPTFVVISYNSSTHKQQICFSASSHFDAEIAMTRAICEHNQLITLIQKNSNGSSVNKLSYEFDYWLKNSNINNEEFKYLIPNNTKAKTIKDYTNYKTLSLNEQKQKCLDLCLAKNWQLYVADFTRRDINMPVLRVMIPELRTMHTRLGEGRLYSVPVAMGKLKQSNKEENLNPIPIFI